MKIGYACQTVGIPETSFRSCTQKYADKEKLIEITAYNLDSLDRILDYNIKNEIKLFRITSDLVPFGSSPLNKVEWWNLFGEKLSELGKKIKKNDIRVSMHPGQYTVLNSPYEDVVERAIKDLEYHTRVLDRFELDQSHKLVLHIGGIYDDKEKAIKRFIENFHRLNQNVKNRLVLENDDKLYNIKDVLGIAYHVTAPVIFDNLHHKINPCLECEDESIWINECQTTWTQEDGVQKIHYSQQNEAKKPGSHSDTIKADEFLRFCNNLKRDDIHIMLEVKDKNLSALKCMNVTRKKPEVQYLKQEWNRYQYSVLERSPETYEPINELLNQEENYPVIAFYDRIDQALQKDISFEQGGNVTKQVWRYLRKLVTENEQERFDRKSGRYQEGKISLTTLKTYLWELTKKYQVHDLLETYYFWM